MKEEFLFFVEFSKKYIKIRKRPAKTRNTLREASLIFHFECVGNNIFVVIIE